MGVVGGRGKNFGFTGILFYKLESRKEKTVSEPSIYNYFNTLKVFEICYCILLITSNLSCYIISKNENSWKTHCVKAATS